MSERTQPPIPDDETTAHEIPGWDRPAWAVRGVKGGPELIWQREASVDVTYADGGVEETFAAELVRTDQVAIDEAAPPCASARRLSTSPMMRTSRRARPGSSPRRCWSWPSTPTASDDRRVCQCVGKLRRDTDRGLRPRNRPTYRSLFVASTLAFARGNCVVVGVNAV